MIDGICDRCLATRQHLRIAVLRHAATRQHLSNCYIVHTDFVQCYGSASCSVRKFSRPLMVVDLQVEGLFDIAAVNMTQNDTSKQTKSKQKRKKNIM